MSSAYFIGVDVGTGSTRAALVAENGKIVKTAVENIQTWNPKQDFYEQSSDNIWDACVNCVKVRNWVQLVLITNHPITESDKWYKPRRRQRPRLRRDLFFSGVR